MIETAFYALGVIACMIAIVVAVILGLWAFVLALPYLIWLALLVGVLLLIRYDHLAECLVLAAILGFFYLGLKLLTTEPKSPPPWARAETTDTPKEPPL